MGRFYVPKESVKENSIVISGQEAHHIIGVMRLKIGDEVVAFDGTGREYVGRIKEHDRKSLKIDILRRRDISRDKGRRIILMQAIPKKNKMDYIVEKSTELGVGRIVPVFTDRTIVDWDDKKVGSSLDRWRKIAVEAAKQCGRADVPEIDSVLSFKDAISSPGPSGLSLIAALSDDAVTLKKAISGYSGGCITIAIGPEGDFTPREIKEAQAKAFTLVNLGSNVLKSDTAGLAVLAIINYECSG